MVYGDNNKIWSFQYVTNLVDGLIRLMESNQVGPFNLGNLGVFLMLELTEVVKRTIDSSARIEFKENTIGDPHKRKPDIIKARKLPTELRSNLLKFLLFFLPIRLER